MRRLSAAAAAAPASIPSALERGASQWRFKDLYINAAFEGSWTYEEFHQLVREHAVGLLESRYRPGDAMIVALDAAETTESVVTLLGAALADLRVEALDTTTLTGASLAKALRTTNARGITLSPSAFPALYEAVPQLRSWPYGQNYRFPDYPNLKMAIQTHSFPARGLYTFQSTFVRDPMPDPLVAIARKQSAASPLLVHGSHTHGDFITAAQRFAAAMQLNVQDRVLVDLPQNTPHSLATGLLACVAGSSLMVSPGVAPGSGEAIRAAIAKHECTAVVASPAALAALLKALTKADARRVTKVAVVVDPQSPVKRTAALQQELAAAFPSLQRIDVFYVDARVGVGALTHSGNALGSFTDSVGRAVVGAGVNWATLGASQGADGVLTLQ